ncbi:AraC family transcriptional regulator [Paenibacillus psychroresistens]|uniref:AraC family transcriptional regulator n=1 Tax=Paenibacillus psychroresistens TaxID=1778678 RepID=A0A6B8RPY7_9BACL|nr:AraC family transcriptional regulator [Paenibacillus psychroresistens]QGQ98430.1 AraC family transcriptional regulator [Paenibacillus psychroresistens]
MNKREPTRLLMHDFTKSTASFHMALHVLKDSVPMHWHDFYELSYILEGEGTQFLNGVEEPLKQGGLMLLTPADFHEVKVKPGTTLRKFNVIFSHELLDEKVKLLLFRNFFEKSVQLGEAEAEWMEADFQRLWREYQGQAEGRMLGMEYTLNRILLDLFRYCSRLNRHEAHQGRSAVIHHALVFMQHHFREALTLEQVAAQTNLSANYFSECFRKVTGITFQQHLLDMRLQFAHALMTSSQMNVTEVCLTSGFNTLNHFERSFKRKYGRTPRSMRVFIS